MDREPECKLAEGFSIWEKAWAQVSFFVMGIAGTVGIVLVDWPWALPYCVICWYGIAGVIMRHTNCPRCPHLHVYGDCVQAPPSFTRWLIKERKHSPMSGSEKTLFWLIFVLIPTYPLYWLVSYPVLLVPFVIGVVAWYSGQYLHLCRRCRVFSCPFNRVPLAQQSEAAGR